MTPIDNLEERLKAQQDDYDAARPPAQGGDEWPEDGTYQALVRRFDFFEGKTNHVAYFKIELEIALDSEYAGVTVDKIHQLEPQGNDSPDKWRGKLGRLKGDLKTLGVPPDTPLTQIHPGSAVLEEVLDVPLEIVIKTSDTVNEKTGEPFRNLYINERLGGPVRSQSNADVPADTSGFDPPPAPPETEDDIPFARPRIPELYVARRNLFVGDRWLA